MVTSWILLLACVMGGESPQLVSQPKSAAIAVGQVFLNRIAMGWGDGEMVAVGFHGCQTRQPRYATDQEIALAISLDQGLWQDMAGGAIYMWSLADLNNHSCLAAIPYATFAYYSDDNRFGLLGFTQFPPTLCPHATDTAVGVFVID